MMGSNIREYQVDYSDPTGDNGWPEDSRWPRLQVHRQYWMGCAKVHQTVIIAGGYHFSGSTHRSTEILNLSTRHIKYAENLTSARYSFHIITMIREGAEAIFALGGIDDSSSLTSVEELDQETMTWNPAAEDLAKRRSHFGAVALPKKLICSP